MDNTKTPSLKLYIIGCILAILLGVILHFAYDFLSNPFIFGLFIPVNESIWEHLKLVLLPMTTFGIIYNFIHQKNEFYTNNFWYYLTRATIFSMLIIVFGHYGYKFIFKEVPGLINILIYILAMIIGFYKIYMNILKQNNDDISTDKNNIGIISLVLMYILFILFTIFPPQVELFKDPVNNTFGIFML